MQNYKYEPYVIYEWSLRIEGSEGEALKELS